MARDLAERNSCCACGTTWQDRPGTMAMSDSCPNCGSVYFRWVNYQEWEAELSPEQGDRIGGKNRRPKLNLL